MPGEEGDEWMYAYKDLRRLTKTATIIVCIYLALCIGEAVLALIEGPRVAGQARGADFIALAQLLTLIICWLVVGRWIYRASVNAHGLSDEMSISPGWAVGWYFIPIMSLFKPFQAMKEIWFASHESTGGYEERAPAVMSLWWGLWILTNALGWMSFQLGRDGIGEGGDVVRLVTALLNVPLCFALVSMMREIDGSQAATYQAQTFA